MSRRIPLCEPVVGDREAELLAECVRSGWISTAGPFVQRFEQVLEERLGSPIVALASGTAALHLGLVLAGVRRGDAVVTSPLSFAATANAIVHAGAEPIFVDVEPEHGHLDPKLVERFLRERCRLTENGPFLRDRDVRIGALLPVHLYGHVADLEDLSTLCARVGLPMVEDACEALGARRADRAAATGYGLAALSFNGNKLVTCGGGGALVCPSAELATRARHLSTQARCHPLEYEHDAIGFNYRMTNVHAAIGCAQLERLDDRIAAKRRIAARYRERLEKIPGIEVLGEPKGGFSTFWMNVIRIDESRFGGSRLDLALTLHEHHIETRPHWRPLRRSAPWSEAEYFGSGVDERIWRERLLLPSSTSLLDEDIDAICDLIADRASNAA